MKNDLMSRDYVEKIIISEFVDLQDGTEEWRTYVNDTCENILNKVHNAPTVEPCYQTTSCLDCGNYDKENHNCPRFCEVIKEAINSRPQGKWKETDIPESTLCKCSVCGFDLGAYSFNFCPNCGTTMKGGAE